MLLDFWSKGIGLGVVALVCIKSLSKIYYTRGPWTATPGLIKIDGKGQSNYKLNVTNIDAIFRETAQRKTQRAVFLFTGITRKNPFSERKIVLKNLYWKHTRVNTMHFGKLTFR